MKATNSNISLDLTEECNLACTYCFTWAKTHKKRVLPRELGYKIIDHWLKNGVAIENRPRELSFWGGEPLLEWELLKDLVSYTNEHKDDQRITFGGTSNGVLYTPDKVEWCKENNALMLISLDGPEHIHDANRCFKNGRGSWKIIDKNLREALKIAPNQMVRASITVQSAPYFLDIVKYFVEDLGVRDFSFSPVYEDPWDKETFAILKDQFEKTIDYMIARRKSDKPIAVKHFDEEANISAMPHPITLRNPCGAGNNYSGWSIDGVHFPCHRFNKHEKTFEERIKSPMAIGYLDKDGNYVELNKEFRQSFLDFSKNHTEQCLSCEILTKSACHGGCYALNYDMTADIHGNKETQCEFNKIQNEMGALYAKKLQEEGLALPNAMNTTKHSCVCFNMCYMENTAFEIVHSNSQSDTACVCYNASYQQLYNVELQARTLEERSKQRNILIDALERATMAEEGGPIKVTLEVLKKFK